MLNFTDEEIHYVQVGKMMATGEIAYNDNIVKCIESRGMLNCLLMGMVYANRFN